jgi:hypothetical protein
MIGHVVVLDQERRIVGSPGATQPRFELFSPLTILGTAVQSVSLQE